MFRRNETKATTFHFKPEPNVPTKTNKKKVVHFASHNDHPQTTRRAENSFRIALSSFRLVGRVQIVDTEKLIWNWNQKVREEEEEVLTIERQFDAFVAKSSAKSKEIVDKRCKFQIYRKSFPPHWLIKTTKIRTVSEITR